jgi:predicted dehydrogenase
LIRKSWLLPILVGCPVFASGADSTVRLLTLDPGHFHAALIQKEMYPGVAETVHVYAPLGPDLLLHLGRVAGFNSRTERPTRWQLEVHTGGDPLARMLEEKRGNVVVISGRNRGKVDRILASVEAGLNVLADKPWLIEEGDLPKLHKALDSAEKKGLVAYDVMTERYEITTILQKELVGDPDVTGKVLPGTAEEPALYMDSVHHLSKTAAGSQLIRPAWFFDTNEQGEALADVGTHLVDLVPFILFPEQAMAESDTRPLAAKRWPTMLSREQLLRVIGEKAVPPALAPSLKDDRFEYFCNTRVDYTLRGLHVRLDVRWDYEASAGGGDTHVAVVRGSRSRLEVRQGAPQQWKTELYVVPAKTEERAAVQAALKRRVAALSARYPGIAVVEDGGEMRVTVPDALRTSHEAHFAEVTKHFLEYLKQPAAMPAWEKANMRAKYALTTRGAALSKQGGRP